jgi:hypothetical protein
MGSVRIVPVFESDCIEDFECNWPNWLNEKVPRYSGDFLFLVKLKTYFFFLAAAFFLGAAFFFAAFFFVAMLFRI